MILLLYFNAANGRPIDVVLCDLVIFVSMIFIEREYGHFKNGR